MCVIGAGAAGIVIARELISSPYKVVLLESGGYRAESRIQQLYVGDSIGEKYYQNLHECRTRYFGGSTNCWGGICTPLSHIDFAKRSWVPWSGWPVRFREVVPYIRRAHDLCGTGPFLYDARAWDLIDIAPELFDPALFHPFVWHFNQRADVGVRFGKRFRGELQRASNIHVLLHANVTELLTDENGHCVEQARIRTLEGRVSQVRAKTFVLACGGIENARLLLASNRTQPNGLGNDRDLVGRFFHEHLQMPCGLLLAPPGRPDAARFSRFAKLGAATCLPGLALAPGAQAAHETLNGSLSVEPFYDPEGALMALQRVRSELKARRLTNQTFSRLWKVARDCRELAPEAWRRFVHGHRPEGDPRRFIVFARAEQAPNPDSRIILSRDTDALGMRRACLDWRTTALDRKAIRLMAAFAKNEFERLGFGEMAEAEWLAAGEWPGDLVGGPHHMGTTRMSADPSSGVVDANCKVHGLDGLYVAGSSVFPTGGHANPTLSIVAFALRLTKHLKSVLAGGSAWFEESTAQSFPPTLASTEAASPPTKPGSQLV